MKRISLLPLAAMLTATCAICQDVLLPPGDQIELRLGGVPPQEIEQISGQYQVDGHGFLNLPHIGKVRAAGLAQAELQDAIEAIYRREQIYTHPTITINVPSQVRFVNVGGDVKTPKRVEFTRTSRSSEPSMPPEVSRISRIKPKFGCCGRAT